MNNRPGKNASSNNQISKRLEKAQAPENNDELNKLLARRRQLNNEVEETPTPTDSPSSLEVRGKVKKSDVNKSHVVAKEFEGVVDVSALKSQLANKITFSSQANLQANTQKNTIQADMDFLRKTPSVREKTKIIEDLMVGTKNVIQVVKANEVSTQAKIELTLKTDLDMFVEVQETMIMNLQEKLNIDFNEYNKISKNVSVGKDKFFELSFIYRSYQVCLEQDAIRHAARKVDSNSKNKSAAPTLLAIQSLNYYEDFFKNLSDIEKIWPDAGKIIRKDEIATMYVATIYSSIDVLKGMLNNKESAFKTYHADLDIYIQKNSSLSTYIQAGNGLDTKLHPWTLNNCTRVAQANSSIKFHEIVATDEVHKNILNDVDKRVEHDTSARIGFNK